VGNEEGAAALEFSLQGPTLRFHAPTLVALCGARFNATLDGTPIAGWWRSFAVEAGQVLSLGAVDAATGVRGYLAVSGGIDVPLYQGSRATFPSGKFGGYQVNGVCVRLCWCACFVVAPQEPKQRMMTFASQTKKKLCLHM
jgi:urea carboxylase